MGGWDGSINEPHLSEKSMLTGGGPDFLIELTDPDPEKKNLAADRPKKVTALRNKLEARTQQLRPTAVAENRRMPNSVLMSFPRRRLTFAGLRDVLRQQTLLKLTFSRSERRASLVLSGAHRQTLKDRSEQTDRVPRRTATSSRQIASKALGQTSDVMIA